MEAPSAVMWKPRDKGELEIDQPTEAETVFPVNWVVG
jgi:hypothetical protein